MKNQLASFLVVLFLLGFHKILIGQSLCNDLKIIEPLLCKNWEGEMKSPDGKRSFKVTTSYESIWNGTVVKFSRAIIDLKSFSEGYIYFDKESNKISIYTISSRSAAGLSEVSYEDSKLLIKGILSIDNRKFDFKNTFEFTPEGKMIDRWFQNAFGPWQAGHVIEFNKSN